MKQLLLLIAGFFCVLSNYSQQKKTIDSLNALLIQNSSLSTDSLLSIYKLNLKNAQKIKYERGIAGSYEQLSGIYGYRGDYDNSVEASLISIKYYLKVNDMEKVADYYGSLGYSMKRGDIHKAQYYMNKGLKIAEKHQFEWILSRTYNNYGVIKEMKEELDSAEFFYRKGLKIVLKPEFEKGLPYSYSNLAGVFGLKNMPDSAFYYLNKALEYRILIGDKKGMAENYTQIGEVYLKEGKNRNAISYFKKAIPLAKQEDYRFLIQYTYEQTSQAFKNLKNTDSALVYYEKYATYKDSLTNLDMQKEIAVLNVEYETELKENEILQQQAAIVEKDGKLQRKNLLVFGLTASVFVLGLLSYLIFSRLKLKHRHLKQEKQLEIALAKLQTQNKLEEQRLRISRDLHDNIGSQLTFIISSLDNLKYLQQGKNAIIEGKVEEISKFTSSTINELRDTIWAMNKETISLAELRERLEHLINNAQKSHPDISFNLNFSEELNPYKLYSSLEGINIYRIIQEALNNALKYSKATVIDVSLFKKSEKLHVVIEDDGLGYNMHEVKMGNGIFNMKKRSKEMQANIFVDAVIGEGCKIEFIK